MKVYELMDKLEKIPAGVEVVCSGIKTIDELSDAEPIGKDNRGNSEYPIIESIVDADYDIDTKRVFLQF